MRSAFIVVWVSGVLVGFVLHSNLSGDISVSNVRVDRCDDGRN